jgi:putative transposase
MASDQSTLDLFVVDGAKALITAIRRTFGAHTPIQRCQVHKGRNIVERLPKRLHAQVKAALRRSLACTNIIENMNGTIRRVSRNVK